MKLPWQIWTLYAACLAIALPALGWLSWQALELDRAREMDRQQTELARREAELQERISSALWRMDGLLTPLIAQEAARPYYLYESFYRTADDRTGDSAVTRAPPVKTDRLPVPNTVAAAEPALTQPSPLLVQPSEFVFLHFQIGPNHQITSPQRPTGLACQQAITSCGLTVEGVANNDRKLAELGRILDYAALLEKCPADKLPAAGQTITTMDLTGRQSGLAAQESALLTIWLDPQVLTLQEQERIQPGSADDDLAETQAGQGSPAQAMDPAPLQKQQAQQWRNRSRGNEEFNKRLQSAGNYARNQWQDNQLNFPGMNDVLTPNVFVNEGIMRPLWIDQKLFLARRVESSGNILIQGCWLDWEKIQSTLRAEVSDLLPDVRFQPLENIQQVRLGQALATLPVQLDIDRATMLSQLELGTAGQQLAAPGGGIRIALAVAWSCLGLATVAGAFLLHGLIQLSERRGAFVSAVTHELRTPLTTFRMYAEMLAERMVPSPEKQQQYAETMRVEADRLSHLVENVLQFARLERTGRNGRRESVNWNQLLDRFADRLQQRADQANMKLVLAVDDRDRQRSFATDPTAIEQILFNLVDNACKYAQGAGDRRIRIAPDSVAAACVLLFAITVPASAPRFAAACFGRFANPIRRRPIPRKGSAWDWRCAAVWRKHWADA